MQKIRIAFGGTGIEHHLYDLMQIVRDFDTKHQFEVFHVPDRASFFSRLNDFDIYHELFSYHATVRFMTNRLLGKKNVCHWIGSDVLRAQATPWALRRTRWTARFVDLQLADAPNLIDELAPLGIQARLWSFPLKGMDRIPVYEPPQQFMVLAYLPDRNPTFYGADIIFRLAEELPEVRFLIVDGTPKQRKVGSNMEFCGWVDDMETIYRQTSVLIRATPHDGNARMVIEALARGIQVIFSAYPRPHCVHASGYDAVKRALLEFKAHPRVNSAGAAFVRETYDYETLGTQLLALYRRLHEQGRV